MLKRLLAKRERLARRKRRMTSRTAGLRASTIFIVLLFAVGSFAAAEQTGSKGAVRESASVTVVEIPVNVIGKDGKPVAGLTAADFELYDDGKKQAITGLDVFDLSRPVSAQTGVAPPIEAAARRHWLIVFDLSYTNLSGLLRSRDGAQAFVAKAMKPSDLAAVATLSVDTGWKLLVNFTADRKQLAQAIDTLGLPGVAVQRAIDPLGFAFAPPGLSEGVGNSGSGKGSTLVDENIKDLLAIQKPATDDLARGRALQLVKSLGTIGRTLDSVRGRKHVLFFSEGFETRLLSGNAAERSAGAPSASQQSVVQDTAAAAASGEYWKIDSDARYGSTSTRSILDRALSEFRRSDTILHTVDITGLKSESDASGVTKPGSGTDALFTLAADTNGEFVRNANQLGGEIEKLVERTDLVYLLIYQPKSLTKPGAFHDLKVKVKASGAKVVARAGYYEPKPYAALSSMERILEAGDAITGGPRQDSFSTVVLTAPFPSGGPLSQVPVILEIPGKPLLAGDTGKETKIQIFAYATDTAGTLTDYLTQELSLDIAKVRPNLEAGGIKFFGTLALPPGEYTVRTLVRNSSSGHSAVTTTSLHINEVPGVAAVVLPPFFREPAGRWIMVKANPRADSPTRTAEYPFALEGESFIPSALPTLESGSTADVVVTTFNLGGGSKLEPLQVHSEITGPDGKTRPVEVQVVKRSDRERTGGRALLLSFKPEGLPAGRYVLKVRVSDRVSRKSSEASTDFEVRPTKG
jgi:VWFA-related protein